VSLVVRYIASMNVGSWMVKGCVPRWYFMCRKMVEVEGGMCRVDVHISKVRSLGLLLNFQFGESFWCSMYCVLWVTESLCLENISRKSQGKLSVSLVVRYVESMKVGVGMVECWVLRRRVMYEKMVDVGGTCGMIFGNQEGCARVLAFA
jgi:hypothetical protein